MENNEILKPKSDVIKPINREAVHKICSGQVVLSLAIAVKELVENAIDASATNIEVRLKEYGLDLIEVLDNGIGIKPENFEALTLKHYTSKIQQFSDLESVCTLGFRGEALSSLCALSDFSIVTRSEGTEYATKIQYNHNGLIVNSAPTARSQGTTVILTNIFATLPVRRKEFTKNLKREFNKMCQLLYAYCLVCKNIKFTCSNITSKGSKNVIVSTQGLNSIKDNIVAVFGSKQISSLISVDVLTPNETILQEFNLKFNVSDGVPFSFDFCISSALHGNGRSTADRQFYYINDRPCEPNKITKLINEVYRQFNGNQYPFVYLNIILEKSEIDVNVTPDKRQIFLEKEKLLLATIKSSLLNAFQNFPSSYQCQNLDVSRTITEKRTCVIDRGLKRSPESTINGLEAFKKKPKKEMMSKKEIVPEEEMMSKKAIMPEEEIVSKKEIELQISNESNYKQITLKNVKDFDLKVDDCSKITDCSVKLACKYQDETKRKPEKIVNFDEISPKKSTSKDCKEIKAIAMDVKVKGTNWDVTLDQIINKIKTQQLNQTAEEESLHVKFRSKILPNSNKDAEQELQKQFNKDTFKEMDIIGQFNLGFIIAKLKNDLFIIDQHASDEKYNFEQLQMNTVLENQKLVNPKPLELTAANECLLIENLDIFNKSGFQFIIKENEEATKKIYLTAIPVSRNYSFGKDDIDEMLFMLRDSNITTCRPSRIRSMFASRACRKSVMVGRHLGKNEMKKIVEHMGEIEQPWNCPHGRPTMRHLVNLGLIDND